MSPSPPTTGSDGQAASTPHATGGRVGSRGPCASVRTVVSHGPQTRLAQHLLWNRSESSPAPPPRETQDRSRCRSMVSPPPPRFHMPAPPCLLHALSCLIMSSSCLIMSSSCLVMPSSCLVWETFFITLEPQPSSETSAATHLDLNVTSPCKSAFPFPFLKLDTLPPRVKYISGTIILAIALLFERQARAPEGQTSCHLQQSPSGGP